MVSKSYSPRGYNNKKPGGESLSFSIDTMMFQRFVIAMNMKEPSWHRCITITFGRANITTEQHSWCKIEILL
uniref:Uncharacterized protein n=1 Tax=Aegilops tauschii subsp. strangulata TaxID=200361 RepID=A0A453BBJ1_AEGTS